MNGCGQASILIELGRALLLTRGGPVPPSIQAWPLRVYAGFGSRVPRFVRLRTVGATDAPQVEDDRHGPGGDPLEPTVKTPERRRFRCE
jgi:hypothetical protein